MNPEKFRKLTSRQKEAMVIAMHVRNSLEDFHVKHLSDAQMKEINIIIRQAILEGLVTWEKSMWHAWRSPDTDNEWSQHLAWLMIMIPEYWEIPQETRFTRRIRSTWKKTRQGSEDS